MDLTSVDITKTKITTHNEGRPSFIIGLLDQINFSAIFDENLTSDSGRSPDISYGTIGKMMIVNMCDDHHPLSRMNEYYKEKDLEGIFHEKIDLTQINDDRFGIFLDKFYDTGPRKIFSKLSANAFARYGIKVKNINFDTTSKIMWGKYDSKDGNEGVIVITYGHSKQKRGDKPQLKIGLGTANGIVVDGKVLSGNIDDKIYNKDNLGEVEKVLENLKIDKEKFLYIADSSLFTEENLKEANLRDIRLVTSMPGTSNFAKKIKDEAILNFDNLKEVIIPIKSGSTNYKIAEGIGFYKNNEIKYVYCYNEGLKSTKEGKLTKKVETESKKIEKQTKFYKTRKFACEDDAKKEVIQLEEKTLKDVKFHNIEYSIIETIKAKRGRPSKKVKPDNLATEYTVNIEKRYDKKRYELLLKEECIFTVCSNDISLTGEEILREYKTQDSVEKRFQQLKSPQFVNSLFLESPKRIEAMVYLMLITIMSLSIAEYVVRRELKKDNDFIIGPGKIKMKQPTLKAIYQVFHTVQTIKIVASDGVHRQLNDPLEENVMKILKYLGISEDTLTSGCK